MKGELKGETKQYTNNLLLPLGDQNFYQSISIVQFKELLGQLKETLTTFNTLTK